MRRYALFAGSNYYPEGGWHDRQGYFSSPDKALAWLASSPKFFDWYHIIDLRTGSFVAINPD